MRKPYFKFLSSWVLTFLCFAQIASATQPFDCVVTLDTNYASLRLADQSIANSSLTANAIYDLLSAPQYLSRAVKPDTKILKPFLQAWKRDELKLSLWNSFQVFTPTESTRYLEDHLEKILSADDLSTSEKLVLTSYLLHNLDRGGRITVNLFTKIVELIYFSSDQAISASASTAEVRQAIDQVQAFSSLFLDPKTPRDSVIQSFLSHFSANTLANLSQESVRELSQTSVSSSSQSYARWLVADQYKHLTPLSLSEYTPHSEQGLKEQAFRILSNFHQLPAETQSQLRHYFARSAPAFKTPYELPFKNDLSFSDIYSETHDWQSYLNVQHWLKELNAQAFTADSDADIALFDRLYSLAPNGEKVALVQSISAQMIASTKSSPAFTRWLASHYSTASVLTGNAMIELLDKNGTDQVKVFMGAVDFKSMPATKFKAFVDQVQVHDSTLSEFFLAEKQALLPTQFAYATKKLKPIQNAIAAPLIAPLYQKSALLEPALLHDVVANQDYIETSLDSALENVIQANAPPAGAWTSSTLAWSEFIDTLPMSQKKDFVYKLLVKNATTASSATTLISQLKPEPGVIEAVNRFLVGSTLSGGNRTQFSQEQVLAMFGGQRFLKFFPHIFPATLGGGIRTQFILAIFTSPYANRGLNQAWLTEKLNDTSVNESMPSVLGYRPALTWIRLRNMLPNFGVSNNAEWFTATHQIRGLTVQGGYQRNGFSIMTNLNAERGQAHVENEAIWVADSTEAALRAGPLANQVTELERKLFAQNWQIKRDGVLIENIRNRAEYLGARVNGFWSLRVEIHNFPNHDTLRRTKDFFTVNLSRISADHQSQFRALIAEIETLLGSSQNFSQIADAIADLGASDATKLALNEILSGYDRASPIKRIEILNQVRLTWDELKLKSTSTLKQTERYAGDRILSGISMAKVADEINRWDANDPKALIKAVQLGKMIVKHTALDFAQSAEKVAAFEGALKNVMNSNSTSSSEKKEFVIRLFSNYVDSIHFELQNIYGKYDEITFQLARKTDEALPTKFVDSTLRSSHALLLADLVNKMKVKQPVTLDSVVHGGSALVENPGDAVGILRVGKDPLELTTEDIGVFDQLPTESGAMAGVISFSSGAQLSHMQLLAKALKIPNVSLSKDMREALVAMNGKLVRLEATKNGGVIITEIQKSAQFSRALTAVEVPQPDHSITSPATFEQLAQRGFPLAAGPKTTNLARLYTSGEFAAETLPGTVLPFGYFNHYAQETGLDGWLKLLSQVKLENKFLTNTILAKIRTFIQTTPMPESMVQEAVTAADQLLQKSGATGAFFRSDTQIEDLKGFNGAGLNTSVPNVIVNSANVQSALQTVWMSPFTERSVYWRGAALGVPTVSIAEPSTLIMPNAKSLTSGVLLTHENHSTISSSPGISGVVAADAPVDEFYVNHNPFEIIQYGMKANSSGFTLNANGGLDLITQDQKSSTLNAEQISTLSKLYPKIEKVLGHSTSGWDIEWAMTPNLVILQSRNGPEGE